MPNTTKKLRAHIPISEDLLTESASLREMVNRGMQRSFTRYDIMQRTAGGIQPVYIVMVRMLVSFYIVWQWNIIARRVVRLMRKY